MVISKWSLVHLPFTIHHLPFTIHHLLSSDKVLMSKQTIQVNNLWAMTLAAADRLAMTLWRGLRRAWLLIVCCVIVLIQAASTYYLPQLPGQLHDDPLAAERWVVSVSAGYGLAAVPLRALGFFNVLHSLLLHLLLALIGLILLVQLGDQLSIVWQWRKLAKLMAQPPRELGSPLPLNMPQPIFRLRTAHPLQPTALTSLLHEKLAARFELISAQALTVSSEPPLDNEGEMRLLATRHLRRSALQPLLLVGLLLLLFAIWLIIFAGWAVLPSALAPGTEYRYPERALLLRYAVTGSENTTSANAPVGLLAIQIGNRHESMPVAANTQLQIGQVEVTSAPGTPGLFIGTDAALLERPGQPGPTEVVGLVFPNPGSEESVLLPSQGAALRIVRTVADNDQRLNADIFLVEVYQSNQSQPGQRIQIRAEQKETIQIGNRTVDLRFVPLPSLSVAVRYLPGAWLLWPALLFMLIGAFGYARRPAFLVAQIAHWPEQRSVLVVQSDVKEEVNLLRQWVSGE